MMSAFVASRPLRRLCRGRLVRSALLALLLLLSGSLWAGVFTVTTGTTDLDDKNPGDGTCADVNNQCSLRAAIDEANATAGPHSISFAVPIVLVINGGLPTLTAPVIMTGPVMINGTGNAFAHGCLDLEDASTAANPSGATGSTLTLLSIVNCSGDGIVANGHGYHIVGNFIGVDPTGLLKMGNAGNGIIVSASHVYGNVDTSDLDALFQTFPQLPVQGGDIQTFVQNLSTKLATLNPDTITGNVISGNGADGINIHSENLGAVFVSGNMIGTDISGNLAIGNTGAGVHLNAYTFGNVIGPNNVISGNLGNGITDDSPTVYLPNFIMGNRIGLAASDSAQHIGNGLNGIYTSTAQDSSTTNHNPSGLALLIGPANLISDNQGAASSSDPDTLNGEAAGIYITGSSNSVKVQGNTIGMAEFPTGTPLESKSYGNAGDGIVVTAGGNTIGGSSAGAGNVIAGNARHGIVVSGSATTSTHILGNTIGIYPAFAGDMALGNGYDGVHVDAASSTDVGGAGASDFNLIVANGRNGVKIRNGGLANGWANLVQRNQIFGNARGNSAVVPILPPGAGVGIDLDHLENATDPLHSEFPQNYANLDQSAPVICSGAAGEPPACSGFTAPSSAGGVTSFNWTLATHGPATFRLEFFSIDAADANAATHMTFLGEQQVTADSTGVLSGAGCIANLCAASIAADASGSHVLMTATDITPLVATPGNLGDWKNSLTCFIGDLGIVLSACTVNDTSEFSNAAAVPLDANANLSALAVSAGSLSPAFASNVLSYNDSVGNAVSAVTVTPTLADGNATVTVNGNNVASGVASASIGLGVGATTVNVVVTAQDGTTTQTYVVTVNRAGAQSNNADLSGLSLSSSSLVPSFAANVLAYNAAVGNAVTSVMVTPTLADLSATVTVNGTPVSSGAASAPIMLAVGANAITVLVTAQDGSTTKSYTITVNRAGAQSNNANLSNLAVSAGSLSPGFASNVLGYTDAVGNATGTISLTPTLADATASVTVNGSVVASGSPSAAIALAVGVTTIDVVVTAQDSTTQTYSVVVNRAGAQSNNASLAGLTISAGSLTPGFASNVLGYGDAVGNAIASLTVTPTLADATASIKVNGNAVASGLPSGPIALVVGVTSINVVVTAQDGTSIQTYTIAVNRAGAQSNNASLAALTVSGGSLTPGFASNVLGYGDAVGNAIASLTVTPTLADATASIKVNGNVVASGSPSGPIALVVGVTNINVVVTAQDGTTTQTYTIAVNRAGALSNNANLSGLSISAGSLSPAFAGNVLSYADAVPNTTTTLTLTATLADTTATLKVNGVATSSGSPSAAVALAVGANPLSVLVTAQDGTTTQTYTVVVTRAPVPITSYSATTSTNSGIATATLSGGGAACTFANAAFVGPSAAAPAGVTFPDGLFQFSTSGCVGSISVAIAFPTAFAGNEQYWKYGPTAGQTAPHWYLLGAGNGLAFAGNTVHFTIADGGLGDDDLSVNGTIVDAGGPAVAAPAGGQPIVSVPTLGSWAMLVLLLLVGGIGARLLRQLRN